MYLSGLLLLIYTHKQAHIYKEKKLARLNPKIIILNTVYTQFLFFLTLYHTGIEQILVQKLFMWKIYKIKKLKKIIIII